MRRLTAFTLVALMALAGLSPWTGAPYRAAAQADELFFTILHTNDEHSALSPLPLVDHRPGEESAARGGYARLARAVKDIRAQKAARGEPVLLFSGGDYMGGSPFSWLSLAGKAPELALMNAVGYDAFTGGNHDYDYGPQHLAAYLKEAGYPREDGALFIASNLRPPAEHPLNETGFRDWAVLTLDNGLKVGLFSLIGVDAINVAPYAEPIEFADQAETARAMVAALKKEGVDVVVALSHSGEDEDAALVRAVPGIDLIVGGHTHTLLEEPIIEGETLIVQAGENLQHLGYLELAYSPSTGKVRVRNPETAKPYVLPLDSSIPEDPEVAALVAGYTRDLNALVAEMTGGRFTDIAETVVWSEFALPNGPPLQETPFGNFVTDAMRLIGEEVTGEKVHLAIQANGVIRGGIVPGNQSWSRDRVSFYDLANLVGLGSGPDGQAGYPLVSIYLTGQELRRVCEIQVLLAELMGDTYYLQFSGVRMTFDRGRAVLLTLPLVDLPVPTTRAVEKAELYTGPGVQAGDQYRPLKKRDKELYHLVTDYYLVAFLPMVGDLLPSLEVVPKDKTGKPIEDFDQAIIYREDKELKVWEAVLEYAAAQPLDSAGNPRIAPVYAQTAGRLVQNSIYPPLWKGLVLALFLLPLLFIFLSRWLRRRRVKKAA